MFVDSHCHLDRVSLENYHSDFRQFVDATREAGVSHMLCVSIDLERYPDMLALVSDYPDISVSVGVHPNDKDSYEPKVEELVSLAEHPKNVAIGETGLDYFHSKGDLRWQQDRFRRHIQVAKLAGKPLIIHTREARQDTLSIMTDENARDAGGVMHCFTETWDMARAALDMNFYKRLDTFYQRTGGIGVVQSACGHFGFFFGSDAVGTNDNRAFGIFFVLKYIAVP